MPTSHFYQINEIMEWVFLVRPKTMLDVGVGFGKYGFLAREYLELWDGHEHYGKNLRRIDGIEAFPQYITPLQKLIYDHIYVGDALNLLPTLEIRYDLITTVDVLEHFDYERGVKFLHACSERARNVILSTPQDIGEQGSAFGNPYETHRFQWKWKHLRGFENAFYLHNDTSILVCFGEDAAGVRSASRYCRLIPRLKRCFPLLDKLARKIKGEPCSH
jgi:hypothetical protein